MAVPPVRSTLAPRWIALGILALALLIPMVALAWLLSEPQRAHAAAQARWAANAPTRYRLETRMLGWSSCRQAVEAVNDRIVTISENTCRYFSPRDVSALFSEVARFQRGPEIGVQCRRGLPGRDCACYAPYVVTVQYHPTLGYPEDFRADLGGYAPNRLHWHYWRALITNRREPSCGGPVEPGGRHVVIREFQPLP